MAVRSRAGRRWSGVASRGVPLVAVLTVMCSVTLAACSSDEQQADKASFDELFGASAMDQVQMERDVDAAVVDATRACLRKEGWEVPVAGVGGAESSFVADVASMSTEREFVERYGYGIVQAAIDNVADLSSDPWSAYRNSLDTEQRPAFDRALAGDGSDAGDGAAATATSTGCYAKATESAGGSSYRLADARIDLEARIDADPEMRRLEKSFISCMATSGFEATHFYWGREEVARQLTSAISGLSATLDDGATVPIDQVPTGGAVVAVVGAEALDGPLQSEIAIATADWTCRNDEQKAIDSVRSRYEKEFAEQWDG